MLDVKSGSCPGYKSKSILFYRQIHPIVIIYILNISYYLTLQRLWHKNYILIFLK